MIGRRWVTAGVKAMHVKRSWSSMEVEDMVHRPAAPAWHQATRQGAAVGWARCCTSRQLAVPTQSGALLSLRRAGRPGPSRRVMALPLL